MSPRTKASQEQAVFNKMADSVIYFIELMWGLTPQPLKESYQDKIEDIKLGKVIPEVSWFEPFVKGKMVTWQQWCILLAVERAIHGISSKKMSIRSGNGIGKTTCLSWIIIWYLFCHANAQIPCTAPSSEQMHDVLWKELALWLNRLPEGYKQKFEWTREHLRVSESPQTWFARAKTARKENPEALAGMHGDNVLFIIDEASGVNEIIFTTAEGALTGDNVLVIMISNPTRRSGYFYKSHTQRKQRWQTLAFNSLESPIVDEDFVNDKREDYGEDSDEFRVYVKGEFPSEDAIDDEGWISLIKESDLRYTMDAEFLGRRMMGVDPSGEGDDETVWVIRDSLKAKVIAKEKISDEKTIAAKTLTLMDEFKVDDEDVTVDNFGVGANVSRELALVRRRKVVVNAVNVGQKADDNKEYQNSRAEAYDRLRQWLRKKGELVNNKGWEELLTIKYRRVERTDQMAIMSKKDMRKRLGFKSPNIADALMLTFVKKDKSLRRVTQFTPNFIRKRNR